MKIFVSQPDLPEMEMDLAEVNAKLSEGKMPANSYGWHEEMSRWVLLEHFPGVHYTKREKYSTLQPPTLPFDEHTVSSTEGIFTPPSTPSIFDSPFLRSLSQTGIRRLPYFLVLSGLLIAYSIFSAVEARTQSANVALLSSFLTILFGLVGPFFPLYYRLKNIGKSPWYCLLLLIPFLNVVVMVTGLIYQEDYQSTKKLDDKAKIGLYIFLGVFLLFALPMLIIFLANAGGK
jgi:uncharacterized membrane protein YhaH (DUF805 family)